MINQPGGAALVFLVLFSPMLGYAQEADDEADLRLAYGEKATVSIATGSSQALRRAPAVATVITAEDIAATGATDISEVLETVPGLHVSRASIRYAPTYIIRGIGGGNQTNSQVLLLQNGIPMTTMFNGDKGSAWLGDVPLENVARIEVIRGPGSALYGADAYAGVINVITKTAAETPDTEVGVRGGSFATRNAWVQHGGAVGPLDVAAYLRVGSTDGVKEIVTAKSSPAPGPLSTGYDAVDASLNASYEKFRLRAAYKLRDHLGTGAGLSTALDPISKSRAESLSGDFSWTDPQLGEHWGAGITAAFLYYIQTYPDNVILLPATALPPNGLIGGPNQWERQLRLAGFATYTGFADQSLRFGFGRDDLDLYKARTYNNFLFNAAGVPVVTGPVIDATNIQPHIRPQSRAVDYFYVQDEWNVVRDWTLTAGVRHDRYSDFGGTTNPRLALVWDAAYDVTAKLLYGRAFRAPSFNEQYGLNPVAKGNPNLRPETVGTLEAAVSWQANQDTQINLNVFRYNAKDMIRLLGTAFANTGAQHGTGMELEAVWDASHDVRFTANYSQQKSIDDVANTDAGYAPHRRIYARADWLFTAGWFASAQLNRVADRLRAAGDSRPPVPDYTTVDITLRTNDRRAQWDFAASIRNLFNAKALEPTLAPGTALPNDLPLAPRSLYLQVVYRL